MHSRQSRKALVLYHWLDPLVLALVAPLALFPERFPREAGYNRSAESNRLIVLYPQVKTSFWSPRRCWDWWGYTGSAYHTKDGEQIRAVHEMLKRLSAPSTSAIVK